MKLYLAKYIIIIKHHRAEIASWFILDLTVETKLLLLRRYVIVVHRVMMTWNFSSNSYLPFRVSLLHTENLKNSKQNNVSLKKHSDDAEF